MHWQCKHVADLKQLVKLQRSSSEAVDEKQFNKYFYIFCFRNTSNLS